MRVCRISSYLGISMMISRPTHLPCCCLQTKRSRESMMACFHVSFLLLEYKKGESWATQLALLFGSFWYLSNTSRRGWFCPRPSCSNHGGMSYCFVVCILNYLHKLHHCYKMYYVVPHHLKQNFVLHTILGHLFWMNESYARMQQFSHWQVRLKISL